MWYVALAMFAFLCTSASIQVLVRSRTTRSPRFRLFGNRRFSTEWWSGCALTAAFACAGLGPLADLSNWMEPVPMLDRTWLQVLGMVGWCGAAVVVRAAQVVLGASWRIGVEPEEREALVLRGPFRVVRHPMYTGLVVLLAAEAMVDPTWIAIAAPVLALAGWELLVRFVEEPHLIAAHPEYAHYRARVGRFLPAIGRVGTSRR